MAKERMYAVKVTTKNGNKFVGYTEEGLVDVFDIPGLKSIDVMVKIPYMRKDYVNKTCVTLSDKRHKNGMEKWGYVSNDYTERQVKDTTVIRLYDNYIKSVEAI